MKIKLIIIALLSAICSLNIQAQTGISGQPIVDAELVPLCFTEPSGATVSVYDISIFIAGQPIPTSLGLFEVGANTLYTPLAGATFTAGFCTAEFINTQALLVPRCDDNGSFFTLLMLVTDGSGAITSITDVGDYNLDGTTHTISGTPTEGYCPSATEEVYTRSYFLTNTTGTIPVGIYESLNIANIGLGIGTVTLPGAAAENLPPGIRIHEWAQYDPEDDVWIVSNEIAYDATGTTFAIYWRLAN